MHGDIAVLEKENGIRSGSAKLVLRGKTRVTFAWQYQRQLTLLPEFALILSAITASLSNFLRQESVAGDQGSNCSLLVHCRKNGHRRRGCPNGGMAASECKASIRSDASSPESRGSGNSSRGEPSNSSDADAYLDGTEQTQNDDPCRGDMLKVVESFRRLSAQFHRNMRTI